jgi:hypothetical protein
VFGKSLSEQPLHARTLAQMEVEGRGNLHFVLDMARLLGKSEVGESTAEDELLLRLLTPVCKLYTAKQVLIRLSSPAPPAAPAPPANNILTSSREY